MDHKQQFLKEMHDSVLYCQKRQAVFWRWLPKFTWKILCLKEKPTDINIPKQQFEKQTQITNIADCATLSGGTSLYTHVVLWVWLEAAYLR